MTWQEMREKFVQGIPDSPKAMHEVFGVGKTRSDELLQTFYAALQEKDSWTDILKQIMGNANNLNEFALLLWAAARTYSMQHDSDKFKLIEMLSKVIAGGGDS